MNIIITKDYEELSNVAGAYLLESMTPYQKVNVSITAGRTPKLMYERIVPFVKNNPAYKECQFYNFDEIPVRGENMGLTQRDLRAMFFQPVEMEEENLHFLTVENYKDYDKMLEEHGGLDFVMIGIGADGHFCGNLPGTCTFEQETHLVRCDITKRIYDRITFLQGGDASKVSEYYVSMGPKTIMNARKIVLIVNGLEKANILQRALEGPIDEKIPSSILRLHPNFIVIADEEAASCLKR